MVTSQLSRAIRGIAAGILFLATVLATVMPGTVATAASLIQPTTQTRSVSSSAFAQDLVGMVSDANPDQATDFLPFSGLVSATATLDGAEGTGGGIQNSEIQDDAIVATGSSSATAESFDDDGVANGSGSSIVIVDFILLAEANYTLQGTLGAFDNGSAQLTLRDTMSDIFHDDATGTIIINDSGTLPAGQYTLEIDASSSAVANFPFDAAFANAEYDITLQFTSTAVPAISMEGLIALSLLLAVVGIFAIDLRRSRACR